MTFRDHIPQDVLSATPEVSQYVDVLSELQAYKSGLVINSSRYINYALCTDKKWLLKYLSDYGISDMTMAFPFKVLQQFLLNVDIPYRYKGSIFGFEVYCNLLTFGEVTIEAEGFIPNSIIVLDSITQGIIVDSTDDMYRYIVTDSEEVLPKATVSLSIKSSYFSAGYEEYGSLVKDYIKAHINEFLPFSPLKDITYTFEPLDYYVYHDALNGFFLPTVNSLGSEDNQYALVSEDNNFLIDI